MPSAPPRTVIDARAASAWLPDVAELWRFRDLLVALIARDVTVRYRQAAVGVVWALIQPLTQLALWATLFGLLGKRPTTGESPYLLSALCGLVFWQFVGTTVTAAGSSLLNNREMVTKVYFPRLFLPLASAGAALLDTLVGFGCLLAAMAIGATAGGSVSFDAVGFCVGLPLGVLMIAATTAGLSCALAGWTALYRDFRFVTPFLVQTLFFTTPVIYETGLVAERFGAWMPLWAVQPLVGAFALVRWGLLGGDAPGAWVLVSVATSAAILVGGAAALSRASDEIADRI